MVNIAVRWVTDLVTRKPGLIAVVGDSHSLFCFCEIDEARIYWRGPVLMHRVGRDGVASILPRRFPLRRFDGIVFVFGEIDCRVHVARVAARLAISTDAVVDDLVPRYIASIREFRAGYSGRIAISCVIPPAAATLPIAAVMTAAEACLQQVQIRRYMNTLLRRAAAEHGLDFVDFYDAFAVDAGEIDPARSDQGVHIDPRQTGPVLAATAAALALPLTPQPLDRDIFLWPVGNYWRRRRQLLDQWFKDRTARILRRPPA
jgi:hypothetical protein